MGKMTVYHGSYTAIQKPEIRIGKNTKDFGAGFSCTTIHERALKCLEFISSEEVPK